MLACALACVAITQAAPDTTALAQQQQKSDSAPAQTPAAPNGPQKIVTQGVEVEFTIEPVAPGGQNPSDIKEEQDARVRFRITDTATHTPLAGVRPSAWLAQRASGDAKPEACKEKIQSFLQGSMRSRPDVDLNSYYLLALNQEPNISVIDPLLGFGGSKLVTLVMLNSPGEDWVITGDQERLFVSMPAVNQVAVVDTNTWKVIANIDAGSRPTRLALQPDEKYLWVGTDEGSDSGVSVIDTTTLKVAAHIATGAGRHELALSGNNRFAYVTNRDAGTLSIIDGGKLSKIGDVKIGRIAHAVAVSPLSKSVYVSDGESIAVVDGPSAKLLARIAAPGIGAVRFEPGGRYGFMPDAATGAVYIFDASTNRMLHTVKVGKGPDQIAFTKGFAYVRSSGTFEVSMIRLVTVGKQLDVTKFPAGQAAPNESRTPAAAAASIVTAPEPNSVFVANVADQQMYFYTEGMAAPMGSLQNYKREPRAVLVADRSLREVKSGTYETITHLPKGGLYDVAFLLDSPRVAHCFEAKAAVNPSIKHESAVGLRIEYLETEKPLRAGEEYALRFRLADAASGKPADGLEDVRVLTFLSPGIWQKRAFARSVGKGVYELKINVPEKGVYLIFVESRSRGVEFRQLPYLTLTATGTSTQTENE